MKIFSLLFLAGVLLIFPQESPERWNQFARQPQEEGFGPKVLNGMAISLPKPEDPKEE